MIFDDVMLDDITAIKKYFCSGRHNNVNVFYLVQSLHKIAKHCIRENANISILFKQDDKTFKYTSTRLYLRIIGWHGLQRIETVL